MKKITSGIMAILMIMMMVFALMPQMEVEAYTVNEVHLKDGDVYDITNCPKNTIIYIDDKTTGTNKYGEVTLKGSSEKVWVDISVSKGYTVNVKLADGLAITPRSDSAYGTGDNDDTLGWSVAGIYINETKRSGGIVVLTSKKNANVIVESYMRTRWQPVPAIMKNDTKTKLVFSTEDPSNPGTIIARIVKGGDFGGACAIGAYGHGVLGSATSSYTVGNIEFQSGNIEAYGYNDGPGIGAYAYSHVKDLDFTGAHVKAYAGNWRPSTLSAEAAGAGIGTGFGGNVDTITISGGYVEAYGRGAMKDPLGWSLRTLCTYCGPGIGVGNLGHLNEIKITGGTVVAYGGTCDTDSSNSCSGSGIGTTVDCYDNTAGLTTADKITITGGDITAYGGDAACGIGGCVDEILIAPDTPDTELKITAKLDGRKDREGGYHALGAGIGIANNASNKTFSKYSGKITIKGGDITATGAKAGSPGWYGDAYLGHGGGIGPTYSGKVSSINISGGKIHANGGYCSPGIGGYSVVSGELGTVESIHISGGTITSTKPAFSKDGDPLSGIGGCKNKNGDRTDIVITGGSIISEGSDYDIGYDSSGQPKNDEGKTVYGTIYKFNPDVDEWTRVNSFTTDPELGYDYGTNDVYTKEGLGSEDDEVITEFWLPEEGAQDGYFSVTDFDEYQYGSFDTETYEPAKIKAGNKGTLTAFTDIDYISMKEGYEFSGKGYGVFGNTWLSINPTPADHNDMYSLAGYMTNGMKVANKGDTAGRTGSLEKLTEYVDYDYTWKASCKEMKLTLQLEQTGYKVSYDKNKPSDASHDVTGNQMSDRILSTSEPGDLDYNSYALAGWNFTGWNTKKDGSGTLYADHDLIYYRPDWGDHLTLYAQWEPMTYTVTFDPGEATGQDTYTQEFQYDKPKKLIPNSFTYDDGHGFVGWGTLALGSFYEDEATVVNRCTLNEDGSLTGMTLYAKWSVSDSLVIIIIDDGKTVNNADPSCIKLKSETLTITDGIQRSEFGYYVNNIPEGTYTVEFSGDLAVYEPYKEATVVAGKTNLYNLNYYTVTAHETEYCYTYFNDDPHKVEVHVAPDSQLKINTGISNSTHKFNGYTSTGVEPGWENGDKSKAEQTITINGHADIYPTDVPIKYHVAFEQNKPVNASHNVEGSMENQTFDYGEEQDLTQNAFALKGWRFAGWNTEADGRGTPYADKAPAKNLSPVDESIVPLYAQWTPNKYKVIFSATNATGGTMDPQELEYDTAQNLTPNAFERTDWHFTGWNSAPAGGGTAYEDAAEVKNLTLGKSVTLYAQWEHDYYTVNFDKNDDAATGEMPGERIWTNSAFELPLCSYIKPGYHLEAWTTEADGSGDSYVDGEAVENLTGMGGTITLYAQWTANKYTVKYDANGGEGTMEDQAFVYDVAQDLEANGFSREHYDFAGWNTAPDGQGLAYEDQENVTNLTPIPNYEVTLYAQWQKIPEFTVAFETNGGSNVDSQIVEIHQKAKKPVNPTREHYNFDGWYADEAYTQLYDFSQEVTEDITLYAKWNHIKHKITYDLNGGTLDGKTGQIVVEANEGDVIKIMDAPTRKGYTFKYWKGSEYYPGDSYTVAADHTLKAAWKKNKNKNPDNPDDPDNNGGAKTGDERDILPWLTLMILSLFSLTIMIIVRRIRRN